MKTLSRRNILKSGLTTLAALPMATPLLAGAFSTTPLHTDKKRRIIYSPLLRDHLLDSCSDQASIIKLNANEKPYCRVSMGKQYEMEAFANALRELS